MKKCILIIGMHRSGTSAIAGLINILGINFGKELMPATKHNEKGYFENINIYKINEEILKDIGSSWDNTEELPIGWEKNINIQKNKLLNFIEEEFKNDEVFAIKDPRLSLLLPIYLEILEKLNISPILILSEREDAEIIKSIEKRDGFDLVKTVNIIKKYKKELEKNIKDLKYPIIKINYNELIKNTKTTTNKIAGIIGIKTEATDELDNKIKCFVSPTLKHNNLSNIDFLENFILKIEEKKKEIVSLQEQTTILKTEKEEKEKEIVSLQEQTTILKTEKEDEEKKIAILKEETNRIKNDLNNINIVLKNIEKSLTFKILKKYQNLIELILPPQSIFREYYNNLISFNQKLINGEILNTKKENKNTIKFWKKFNKGNETIDILFINHEETRTGAPIVLFKIIKKVQENYKTACVSIEEGSLHNDFLRDIKNLIYPNKIYSGIKQEDKIRDIIIKTNPSLVYVNSIVSYEYAVEAKKLGIKTILHIHELEPEFRNRLSHDDLKNINKFADIFITVSDKVRLFLTEKLKIPIEKTVKINSFIDSKEVLEKSTLDNGSIKKELKIDNRKFNVFSLGSLIRRKGADIFIKSFKILENKYPGKFNFVWIGKKHDIHPEDDKSINNKDNITFIEEKENPFSYLKYADIFALSSREDPFPLVALEAMALSKPVITFKDSGGTVEMIKDSGFIIDKMSAESFAEGIEKAYKNKNLLKKLGDKSKQYQKEYDSTNILPKIENIIENNIKKVEEIKVSIIIANYNYEWCIDEAIESIINQTHKNWELIIVDDASTDKSIDIIKKYQKILPDKIKIIQKNKNTGLADSCKKGILEASGKYIAFLEADDILYKESIKTRLNILEENNSILLFNDIEIFGEKKEIVENKKIQMKHHMEDVVIPKLENFDAFNELMSGRNIIYTMSSIMIKNIGIEKIDFSDKFNAWFDWWFYIQLSKLGDFCFLPIKMTKWRIHEKSYNHNYVKNIKIEEKVNILIKHATEIYKK